MKTDENAQKRIVMDYRVNFEMPPDAQTSTEHRDALKGTMKSGDKIPKEE